MDDRREVKIEEERPKAMAQQAFTDKIVSSGDSLLTDIVSPFTFTMRGNCASFPKKIAVE